MGPQRRYTLFLVPEQSGEIMRLPSFLPGRDSGREAGAVVLVQVVARSFEKALKKVARLYDKPRGRWLRTCAFFSEQGWSSLALLDDRDRRAEGAWLALPDLAALKEAQRACST